MTALLNTQRPHTVLLTDSDSENRVYLRQELEARGFKILEAEDARETLATLASQSVDAVVLDLELSARQRAALMQEILTDKNGNPHVFLLVSPSVVTREEAYDLGAAGAMSKPVDPSYLISRLEALLAPAQNRWNRALAPDRKRRSLKGSVFKLQLGRGGFSVSETASDELLEGDSVEFSVEVEDSAPWTLSGTGIVRYVNLDSKSRRQRGWGIEFESLDEASLKRFLQDAGSARKIPYIPRFVS